MEAKAEKQAKRLEDEEQLMAPGSYRRKRKSPPEIIVHIVVGHASKGRDLDRCK